MEVDLGDGVKSHEVVDLSANYFDSPAYMMGPVTQKEVEKSVDKVDAKIEQAKKLKALYILSFSLGLTQEFEIATGLDLLAYIMGPKT